jgi:aspartate kinase
MHAAEVLSLRSQRVFDIVLQEYLAETDAMLQSHGADAIEGAARDALLATGERLAMHILALALNDAGLRSCTKDAADLVRTDATFGNAAVCLETTFTALRSWYEPIARDRVPVITGFIGRTAGGETTTLGRGGSDYSASLVATALGARCLERWTDVDGIYTSDPRRDPNAQKLSHIVLQDAVSWNHAGRIGLHRKALDPLVEARIPMFVRSIDFPDEPGTAILPQNCEHVLQACC